MCIALPRRVVAIVDREAQRVAIGEAGALETVSAALVADGDLDGLVGRWAIAHAGFVLELLSEEDARSRLAVFAALDGDTTPLDLSDLHRRRADATIGGETS